VIRATNTGATAIVDARGQVTHSLPRVTRGVLTGDVQGRTDITAYAAWLARFGLVPLWLLALASLASARWAAHREARP
jgi:apolipoprotein N-acyltransferase